MSGFIRVVGSGRARLLQFSDETPNKLSEAAYKSPDSRKDQGGSSCSRCFLIVGSATDAYTLAAHQADGDVMQTEDKKLRVLLVEDCLLTAEQLTELVKSGDFDVSVSTATTEEAAIAAAVSQPAELVILDLNLKGGSGFKVLRALKELESPPAIVVMTNFALPRYRELALLMGADYFLDKASGVEILPAILDSIAEKRNYSQEFAFEQGEDEYTRAFRYGARPRLH